MIYLAHLIKFLLFWCAFQNVSSVYYLKKSAKNKNSVPTTPALSYQPAESTTTTATATSTSNKLKMTQDSRLKNAPVYFRFQKHINQKKLSLREPLNRIPGRVILFFHCPRNGGTSLKSLMVDYLVSNSNNPFEAVYMPIRTFSASDKLISELISATVDPNLVMIAEIHRGKAHPFASYANYLPLMRQNIESQGGVLFTYTVLRDPIKVAISTYSTLMEKKGFSQLNVPNIPHMVSFLKSRSPNVQVNFYLRNPNLSDQLYLPPPATVENVTLLIPLMEEYFDDVLILEELANHLKRSSRFIQNFYHVFNQSHMIRTIVSPPFTPSKFDGIFSELQNYPIKRSEVQECQAADIKLYDYFKEKVAREPDLDIPTVLRLQKLPPKLSSPYPPVQTQQVLQYKPQNIFQKTSQQSSKQRSHSKTKYESRHRSKQTTRGRSPFVHEQPPQRLPSPNHVPQYSAEKTQSADSSSDVEQMLKSRIENLMKSKELFQTKEFDAELKSAMRQYDEMLQQNIAKKINGGRY